MNLRSKTERAKLAPRGKPYWVALPTPGRSIGYRRIENAAGSWSLKRANGKGGNNIERIGTADDCEPANGTDVLDYAQAVAKAGETDRAPAGAREVTVAQAIKDYAADLERNGRNPYNATRLTPLLPIWLANRPVADLTVAELRRFRDGLDLQSSTLNRTLKPLKAALSLVAQLNSLPNTNAWKFGLKALPNADRPREVKPLSNDEVFALIEAAENLDPAFGLFVAVGAETGARPSQIAAIRVRDLQDDRLMVPASRKGKATKETRPNAVPITEELAARLRQATMNRSSDEPLLLRDARFRYRTWGPKTYEAQFRTISPSVTFYALRHSAITRQIFANVPLRLIAKRLDTSVEIIEKFYTAQIDGAEDAQLRRGLLERPTGGNVVALHRAT